MKEKRKTLRVLPGSPPEVLVYDRLTRCPYLPWEVARMPLRLPARSLTPEELDVRLERGDRRQGLVFYRPRCPRCQACQPIRLDVGRFKFGRTHRRILRRNDALLEVTRGPTEVDERRVELYNLHKEGRALTAGEMPIDEEGYGDFLVSTCCSTTEIRYSLGGRLIGVAVADRGATGLSAVYCCYDPAYERLSLGTYSILKQIELCQSWGLQYLYLGLFVVGCSTMQYKARFVPHERQIEGVWREFTEYDQKLAESPAFLELE